MSDATIQIAPQSSGPLVDCAQLVNGATNIVYRQTTTLGDPANISAVQTVRLGDANAIQSDCAAVVLLRPDGLGSLGADYSQNTPSYPNVGSNFTSGIFSGWYLIATVPVNLTRAKIMIDNMDTNQMLVVFDDGTATTGQAPTNATGFLLNPKVTTGPEGGHFESTTKRGRAQIYSSNSGAWISASVD